MITKVSEAEALRYNAEFYENLIRNPNETLNKTASNLNTVIRKEVREEGFQSKIMERQPITDDMLDRSQDHDRPFRLEEIESTSFGAVTAPFNYSPETRVFEGMKAPINFHEIKTPKYQKNINTLRTYRRDLRAEISDKMLNDILLKEDGDFMNLVERVVGPSDGVGLTGDQQSFVLEGGVSRSTVGEVKKFLLRFRLPIGCILCNNITAIEFEKWFHDEVGGPAAQDIFRGGLISYINGGQILGANFIFTIKDELVPDNTLYIFTEPQFLGRFYELQAPTLFAEKKENMLTMSAWETIGFSIINTAGVVKVRFTGSAA